MFAYFPLLACSQAIKFTQNGAQCLLFPLSGKNSLSSLLARPVQFELVLTGILSCWFFFKKNSITLTAI